MISRRALFALPFVALLAKALGVKPAMLPRIASAQQYFPLRINHSFTVDSRCPKNSIETFCPKAWGME